MRRHQLYTEEGRDLLFNEYVVNQKSTYVIASEQGTYPNLIRRALVYHKIPLRSHAEAQILAMEKDRTEHPTRDKSHPDYVKDAISRGVSHHWATLPPEERNNRRQEAARQWNSLPDAEKVKRQQAAKEGIISSASSGSWPVRFLYGQFADITTVMLKEQIASYQVDLYFPHASLVVLVHGPHHFLPIHGEQKLAKIQEKDEYLNSQLSRLGYRVIIIKYRAKNKNRTKMLKAAQFIREHLGSQTKFLEFEID